MNFKKNFLPKILRSLWHPAQTIFPKKVLREAKTGPLVAFLLLMLTVALSLKPTVDSATRGLWQVIVSHPLTLAHWRVFGLITYLLTIAIVCSVTYSVAELCATEFFRRR